MSPFQGLYHTLKKRVPCRRLRTKNETNGDLRSQKTDRLDHNSNQPLQILQPSVANLDRHDRVIRKKRTK